MNSLKDTKPRVATCNRCSGVVLAAMDSGCRAAVEPTPLDFEQMREHVIAGRDVYMVLHINGKPWRLNLVTPAILKLPGARHSVYAVAHGCGCHAMDSTAFEEPQDPQEAPASALGGSQGPSRARDATQRRSEPVQARCSLCGSLTEPGERVMIEWPRWDEITHHYQSRGPTKGYDRTFMGWGTDRWTIHTHGCPTRRKAGDP